MNSEAHLGFERRGKPNYREASASMRRYIYQLWNTNTCLMLYRMERNRAILLCDSSTNIKSIRKSLSWSSPLSWSGMAENISRIPWDLICSNTCPPEIPALLEAPRKPILAADQTASGGGEDCLQNHWIRVATASHRKATINERTWGQTSWFPRMDPWDCIHKEKTI